MRNIKSKINEQKKVINTESKLMVLTWERRLGGMGEKGEGIKMYELLVIKLVVGM